MAWAHELVDPSWGPNAQRPWVLTPEKSSHRQLVMELFYNRAAFPTRTIEADNESVITNLIEAGVGVSLVRDEIALASEQSGRLVTWSGAEVSTQLWLITAANRSLD